MDETNEWQVPNLEKMRELQESFLDDSNSPTIRVRRVLVRDGLWVGEGIIDYGNGTVLDSVGVVELKDGKVWRDSRYFAEPFEAPAWRAHLVERMEP